jgi:hypothetical protein
MKLSKGKCGKKRCYLSKEDAIVAASTHMRDNYLVDDWNSFRSYKCNICGWYHLTKGERR